MSVHILNYPSHVWGNLTKHRIYKPRTNPVLAIPPSSIILPTDDWGNLPDSKRSSGSDKASIRSGYGGSLLSQSNAVGIIGGVSVDSTLNFVKKLVQWSSKDEGDGLPFVLCSDPMLNKELLYYERSSSVTGKIEHLQTDYAPIVENLRRKRVFLEQSGARCVVMPCHISHSWHDEVSKGCSVPVLHVGECVAKELKQAKLRPLEAGSPLRIGVLSTSATLAARFYQEKLENEGFEVVLPDKATMEHTVIPAVEALIRKDMEGARNLLRIALQVLLVRAVNTVILASNDMRELLPRDDPLLKKCIDPMDALARSTIKFAQSAERGGDGGVTALGNKEEGGGGESARESEQQNIDRAHVDASGQGKVVVDEVIEVGTDQEGEQTPMRAQSDGYSPSTEGIGGPRDVELAAERSSGIVTRTLEVREVELLPGDEPLLPGITVTRKTGSSARLTEFLVTDPSIYTAPSPPPSTSEYSLAGDFKRVLGLLPEPQFLSLTEAKDFVIPLLEEFPIFAGATLAPLDLLLLVKIARKYPETFAEFEISSCIMKTYLLNALVSCVQDFSVHTLSSVERQLPEFRNIVEDLDRCKIRVPWLVKRLTACIVGLHSKDLYEYADAELAARELSREVTEIEKEELQVQGEIDALVAKLKEIKQKKASALEKVADVRAKQSEAEQAINQTLGQGSLDFITGCLGEHLV